MTSIWASSSDDDSDVLMEGLDDFDFEIDLERLMRILSEDNSGEQLENINNNVDLEKNFTSVMLSSKVIATEPVIARGRSRPKISQCSHSKTPLCDDQRVDPVIENNKDGESNNSHNQDGEKSVTNIEENVKQFTQMFQQGMSNFKDIVAKCDELQNENHELRKKLEIALAKLEEYEKVNLLLSKSIQTFNAWFASSPTILQLGLSPLPSSTDSPKPPEPQKPCQTKNTRKAAGDGGEAPPIATRRKISPSTTK